MIKSLCRSKICVVARKQRNYFVHFQSRLRIISLLCCLPFSNCKHSLLLKQLRKLAILVHRYHNVTASNKFFVQVKLRYCRPVWIFLQPWRASSCQTRFCEMIQEINRYAPCLSSSSSSTLYAANLFGSTPCIPKMVILVLENPHWGRSGVPFINNTTEFEATALSIVTLVSVDRCRSWAGVSEIKGLDLKSAVR